DGGGRNDFCADPVFLHRFNDGPRTHLAARTASDELRELPHKFDTLFNEELFPIGKTVKPALHLGRGVNDATPLTVVPSAGGFHDGGSAMSTNKLVKIGGVTRCDPYGHGHTKPREFFAHENLVLRKLQRLGPWMHRFAAAFEL